jgi:adenylate kinase
VILILFGPPGAGKGTQAQRLSLMRDLRHVSTGDLLRAARSAGTPVGREADAYMSSGRLVPDDVVNRLVAGALEEESYGDVLLDGYPRTMEQAEWLMSDLASHGADVDAVLSLKVPEDDIVRRLSGRRTDSESGAIYHVDFNPPPPEVPAERLVQRDDDRPEAIRKRLDVYREETAPLEAFFRRNARVLDVDGTGDVEAVAARIGEAVATLRGTAGI